MTTWLVSALLGLSGTYVESRTCSIFTGPCHFSGEVMMDGETALRVWDFESGSIGGSAIAGLRIAAVTRAERNFAFAGSRRSIVYLPKGMSEVVKVPLLEVLQRQGDLGAVVAYAEASVTRDANRVVVTTEGRQAFRIETTQASCSSCTMPGQLWYEPLTLGVQVEVSGVREQSLYDNRLGETWTRRDETAAFVGKFSW